MQTSGNTQAFIPAQQYGKPKTKKKPNKNKKKGK